jgi:hypothetical protein
MLLNTTYPKGTITKQIFCKCSKSINHSLHHASESLTLAYFLFLFLKHFGKVTNCFTEVILVYSNLRHLRR